MRLSKIACVALLSVAASSVVQAEVKLPALISDNMLLQSGKPDAIWGEAAPGEKVSVSFLDQNVSTTADDAGHWKVTLAALKPGDAGDLTIKGTNTLTIKNVLVGSVWICSGQSNMQFGIANAHDAAVEIPKAKYPKIRLFYVGPDSALEPQADVAGHWAECTPETVVKQGNWGGFSAVGYFFGRDIYEDTGVPVGLITTNWGGTPAQSWTSIEALKKVPALDGYVSNYEKVKDNEVAEVKSYQANVEKWKVVHQKWQDEVNAPYQEALKAWPKAVADAKAAGQPVPPKPVLAKAEPKIGPNPAHNAWTPSTLYNGMIAPLTNYAIEGAIWYQGESNAGQAQEYQTLFPTMITDWRQRWNEGDFPFVFVQLASFMKTPADPVDTNWARLREAQTMTLALPNTGMAVAIDIGEPADIHPKNKSAVGHRLALAAEKIAYGKQTVTSPLYKSMAVEKNTIRISFSDTGSGLVIGAAPPIRLNTPAAAPATELKGFAIAGADKKFVWANAVIDGNTVVVSSDQVPDPVAVRYAWGDFPVCNLYNKEGLPASPFRTDDWSPPAPVKK